MPEANGNGEVAPRPLRDMVVVGASAGGVSALEDLLAQLPSDFAAGILVVVHTSGDRESRLAQVLARAARLRVEFALQGAAIEPGLTLVAPPDRHLLVANHHVHLSRGPRENMTRPAIDPLFRSAAVHFRSRVIGIVLSGMLDDGTAGLAAIKRCGGVAIVQSPEDALFADMPRSALEHVDVDYCVPISDMGSLLRRLVAEEAPSAGEVPHDIMLEYRSTLGFDLGITDDEELGIPAALSCPECGGPMWQLKNPPEGRYRCHVGHVFSARTLESGQAIAAERALWNAALYLEEHARMLERLAKSEREHGRFLTADRFGARVAEARHHVEQVRAVVMGLSDRHLNAADEDEAPGTNDE